ncbi:MAG TPA: 5-(carboxyamino)imidazole ribonucleotide mutase [Persephonella sp.]|uniref:N5-carboxyaminoimidazole ribonucleotide mutase n=1 Tax=Persephonella marina (strain DSM 14350 / EX-H1) TaxID=123214 RepID=C0QUR5_PERMH|nr:MULTISPECIES: 5-(carboxyamino)imidazole ribonucleotide mutase [Persephonella]ACO03254.1 phosphoribosylaminoimidazole carboxylase, catalytic subunit [Persephonella marina EX-H1]HCB69954.1 5-(carboxyamino)imidazole ribonucleotide mutase [Persephonella sp.]
MKKVAVFMGSKSDLDIMESCFETLKKFDIPFDVYILSAHRTPDEVAQVCKTAEENYGVIIAAAGFAAHLAGTIAGKVTIPVIGIPVDNSSFKGLDSLLSTVMMPPGVPVATVTTGKAGAVNAAVLAAQILSIGYPEVRDKLREYKVQMREKVLKANEEAKAYSYEG